MPGVRPGLRGTGPAEVTAPRESEPKSRCPQTQAPRREAARPEARLYRFIHNHLDHFLTDMDSLTVCTRELGRLNGDYLQQVEALQRAYFSQAFEIFRELCGKHDGIQMDPRTATLAMFGAINWVSTWFNPASDKSAGELAEELVRLYLHGVEPAGREAADRIIETASARKDRGRQ